MEILLDIIRSVDYNILLLIADKLARPGNDRAVSDGKRRRGMD